MSQDSIHAAIKQAKEAIKAGDALNYMVEDNGASLSVETDQGWSVWWPEPEYNPHVGIQW